MNQYLDLKDVLKVGLTTIEVKPLPEFEQVGGKWKPKKDSKGEIIQQVGVVKTGKNVGAKFYKYSTNVKYLDEVAQKERECQIIAWSAKDKAILDTGKAEINILEKPVLLNGEPTLIRKPSGEVVEAIKRIMYINPFKGDAIVGTQDIGGAEDGSTRLYQPPKEFVEDEIPVINGEDIFENVEPYKKGKMAKLEEEFETSVEEVPFGMGEGNSEEE